MSILREIHSWSQGLPEWQQDAIAKLYTNRVLKDSDWEHLYALAKAEVGIDDPKAHKGVNSRNGKNRTLSLATRCQRRVARLR